MNLIERIDREINREIDSINEIIKYYFTGHEVVREWFDLDNETDEVEIGYNIKIDEELHRLVVTINYGSETRVIVEGHTKSINRTVAGHLEQTIKKELTKEEE